MKTNSMNIKKYYKICILCISLLLCFCSFSIITEGVSMLYADSWNTYSFTTADKPEYISNTYIIKTEQNLAYIAKNFSTYRTKTLKLANNLDMGSRTWKAPGTSSAPFTGSFDGGGYVISNLKTDSTQYAGLFGYTSSAKISNVSLANANITGTQYAGAIVAYMTGGSITNCILTNCQVNVAGNSTIYAGGAVGRTTGSLSKIYSTGSGHVYGFGTSTSNSYVGGIAGYSSETISNCENGITVDANSGSVNGTYYSNKSSTVYSGGIVGYSSNPISQCGNTAIVYGGSSSYTLSAYVGGIVGYSYSSNITDCFNTGNGVYSYAKTQTSTETITQKSRDQQQLSTANSWSGVFGQNDEYWYISTSNIDSPALAHQRTINKTYSYAGGIAGYASKINTSYVSENTSVSGGRKTHTDNYMAVYSYSQEVWQYNIVYWTSYYNNNVRSYFLTITYPQELFYSQIAGNSGATLTNTYATKSYAQDFSYSYKTNVWEYSANKRNVGLGGVADLFNLIPHGNSNDNKVGYTSGSGKGSGTISLTGNSYSTDLQEYFSRNQSIGFYVNYSTTSFYIDSKTVHNGSTKYFPLTDNITINQKAPSGYNTKTAFKNKSLSSLNLSDFSTSVWSQNDSINNGFPYIKTNYWS